MFTVYTLLKGVFVCCLEEENLVIDVSDHTRGFCRSRDTRGRLHFVCCFGLTVDWGVCVRRCGLSRGPETLPGEVTNTGIRCFFVLVVGVFLCFFVFFYRTLFWV